MPSFWPKLNKSQNLLGSVLGQGAPNLEEQGSTVTNRQYLRPDDDQIRNSQGVPRQAQPHRYTTSPQPNLPTVDDLQPQRTPDQDRPTQDRYASSHPESYHRNQETKKGLRSKLGFASLREHVPQPQHDSSQPRNIGRSVSLRRKELPVARNRHSPIELAVPSRGDSSSRQSSGQPLTISKEEEHLSRHRYSPHKEQDTPPVPPKDSDLTPGISSQDQRGAHPTRRLQRSGTDSNLLTPGRPAEDYYTRTGSQRVSGQVPLYLSSQSSAQQTTILHTPSTLQASQTGPPQFPRRHIASGLGTAEPSAQYQQEGPYIRPASQQSQSSFGSGYQQYQAYTAGVQGQSPQDSSESSCHPVSQATVGVSNPLAGHQVRRPMEGSRQGTPVGLSKEGPNLQVHGQADQRLNESSTSGISSFKTSIVPSAAQGQSYKNGTQNGEQERANPAPSRQYSDGTDLELDKLNKEHAALKEKYNVVKLKYFEKAQHVEKLQNIFANQRLSLSNTSLDDSGYVTKFNQLEGLVGQLAFSIKKEWKEIPVWLQSVVNKDAITLGSREMIGVGKAVICQWMLDEIFNKYFHPGLEPGLSSQLKLIQNNLRAFAPLSQSNEEQEGLVSKIISWRLATLEGLQELLRSEQASVNQHTLTELLNEKLLASLQKYLKDPLPVGIENGTMMIIQRAIDILQHLPQESREVHIEYVNPGHSFVNEYMKLESGIAALTVAVDGSEADRMSLKSTASESRDPDMRDSEQNSPSVQQEPKKKGMFGGLMSGKRAAGSAQAQGQQKQLGAAAASSQTSLTSKEEAPQRVRFSTGFAVSIRNRMVLVKAPVYTA